MSKDKGVQISEHVKFSSHIRLKSGGLKKTVIIFLKSARASLECEIYSLSQQIVVEYPYFVTNLYD